MGFISNSTEPDCVGVCDVCKHGEDYSEKPLYRFQGRQYCPNCVDDIVKSEALQEEYQEEHREYLRFIRMELP